MKSLVFQVGNLINARNRDQFVDLLFVFPSAIIIYVDKGIFKLIHLENIYSNMLKMGKRLSIYIEKIANNPLQTILKFSKEQTFIQLG